MGRINIASGDDRVAIQVGRVGGDTPPKSKSKAKSAEAKPAAGRPGQVVNVQTGNARVGVQADVVGEVHIRF